MKKILLSFAFIGAVLLGRAQVVFNEFYPNPGTGNDEYLELYNTGGNDINLDCWSILAWDNSNHQGYVYQLPSYTLPGFGFVVLTGSTTGTIHYSNSSSYSGSNILSWNAPATATSSLKLFTMSGNTLVGGANTTTTDFLLDPSGSGGISLFLFNGGAPVNGFIGAGSPAVPADFASLTGAFDISGGTCGSSNVTLSSIQTNNVELQSVVSATGKDHGYYRSVNGLCGDWKKSSSPSEFSPGVSNGGSTGASTLANVTAQSNCNTANGQVTWNVSITITNSAYNPATYVVYEDLNGDHVINTLIDNKLDSNVINDLNTHNLVPFTLGFHHDLLVRVTAQQNCLIFFRNFQISCISLPVSFKSFTAARNHTIVGLKWETAWEQNSNGFAIERNIRGTWEQVAFVPSQAVNGNSNSLLTYQYNDLNNVNGISQYRIKQVDFDNKSKYSDIRAVRGEGQAGHTVVYPNPSFDGRVNIVFEDATVSRDASLSDMAGRVLKQWKGVTNNNIQIDNLTPGMYSLKIVVPETGEQSVQKIIVSKR
ncbi:MAG TPA: lamin tail domain-containing protein [Chitinophagaceae bacterium]|nr:lamin tail domain-containing protein [Chitinophagaceae bacterium]